MPVQVVRNTWNIRLKKITKNFTNSGFRELLNNINIQIRSDNFKNFMKQEEYRTLEGKKKKWKDWGDNTRFYIRKKDGKKVFRKRPSGALYSMKSQLVKDKGGAGGIMGALGGGTLTQKSELHKVTHQYTELGTKIPYASAQDKMRPILSISYLTMRKVLRTMELHAIGENKNV